MLKHMWTWSAFACSSTNFTPLWSHSSRTISPIAPRMRPLSTVFPYLWDDHHVVLAFPPHGLAALPVVHLAFPPRTRGLPEGARTSIPQTARSSLGRTAKGRAFGSAQMLAQIVRNGQAGSETCSRFGIGCMGANSALEKRGLARVCWPGGHRRGGTSPWREGPLRHLPFAFPWSDGWGCAGGLSLNSCPVGHQRPGAERTLER